MNCCVVALGVFTSDILTWNQRRSQPKNGGDQKIWRSKMFDFRRITLFRLEKRLSKHKMTIRSKNFGGQGPFDPPGYAYAWSANSLYSVQ